MNPFIKAAKELIYRNGVQISFIVVTEGTYNPATGSSVNTESSTSVIAFPKRVHATNYNYPNLVGKEVVEYLIVATDLSTKPKMQDKITRGSETYSVNSCTEHVALNEVVIYKVLAVKG